MRLTLAAALVAAFSVSCASTPTPTPERPVSGCAIHCTGDHARWVNKRQRLCRGSRQFEDVLVVGEYQRRGADGTVLTDVWITTSGQVEKLLAELRPCSSVIDSIIQARGASERGQHPGEDPQGRPWP